MSEISNRSDLINKLRNLLPPDEFSRLNLEGATDADLQARLNKALNNNGNWGEFDRFEENEDRATQTDTKNKHREGITERAYFDTNGDEVKEKYNGEQIRKNLTEKIIKHTDQNGKVIETVMAFVNGKMSKKTIKDSENDTETTITYEDGKPAEKVTKQNGEVTETTTYEEITDGTYGTVTEITTEKSDGTKIETLVDYTDENGDFKEEVFCQRTITSPTGERISVRLAENDNLRQVTNDKNGVVVTEYDGKSLSAYDRGELTQINRVVKAGANSNSHFGQAFGENIKTTPVQQSMQQITSYMVQVIDGKVPDKFSYDKKALKNLFTELNSPNCKYEKISDKPLKYRVVEKDENGIVIFDQEVYLTKNSQSLEHIGSFRNKTNDDEYEIFFNDNNISKQYRFKADGTLVCVSVTTKKSPNISTNYYPDGSIVQNAKDKHGRVVQSAFFNKDRELVVTQNYEFKDNGDVDHVTKSYTDKINDPKLQNRLFVIFDSSVTTQKDDEGKIVQSYDRLKYKYVPVSEYNPETMSRDIEVDKTDEQGNVTGKEKHSQNIEIKDDDGNITGYYVYESMRIPETVPVVFDDIVTDKKQITGHRPITSMTIDYEGYITQRTLYKGLNKGLNKFEHCDTSEFDKETKLTGLYTIIGNLENIKGVLENMDSNRSWIDASAWLNQVDALFGGNTTQQNIQIIQNQIDFALSLAKYMDKDGISRSVSGPALETARDRLFESNPEIKQRYDENKEHMSGFELDYYALTGRMFYDHKEQFIRYNQKQQVAENNLRLLYENYKKSGSISEKELDLFCEISGSNENKDTWKKDFISFIEEVDKIKETYDGDFSEFSFTNTTYGSKYLSKMTEGIFKNSAMTKDMNEIMTSEQNKESVGMMLDLAAMALEFGVIAKGINWALKIGKAITIGKSARLASMTGKAGRFLASEGKWANRLNKTWQVTQRATVGGLNFGAYDMTHELGRQIYQNERINKGKLLHRGIVGFTTGASAGVLSTFVSEPLMKWINRPEAADTVGAVGEELTKVSEAVEASAKGMKLVKGAETTAKGTRLADAINSARSAATMANYETARGAIAKGVGFITEVGTFTFASSTINIADSMLTGEGELKEQLIASGYNHEKVENMGMIDLMKAVLEMQGVDANDDSVIKTIYKYAKNEYENQFVGLGKLKITERVLGMFMSKGKMPNNISYGKRVKALEFEPNERGKYYEKGDPTKRELTDAEITSKIEQAMAFDMLEARLQNEFNRYRKKPMLGEDFGKVIFGENGHKNSDTEFADRISIKVEGDKYKITTSNGDVIEAKDIEEVVEVYLKEISYKKWLEQQKELFGDIDIGSIQSKPLGNSGTHETMMSSSGEKINTIFDKNGIMLIRTKGDDLNNFEMVESSFEDMTLPRLINEYKRANRNGETSKILALTTELIYRGYSVDMNTEAGKITLSEPIPTNVSNSHLQQHIQKVKSGCYVIERSQEGDKIVSTCKNRTTDKVEIEFFEYPDGRVESIEYGYEGDKVVSSKRIFADGKTLESVETENGTQTTGKDKNGNVIQQADGTSPLKKEYPSLSMVDKVSSKGKEGSHANLNLSGFGKWIEARNPLVQHQVKNYMEVLLESVPDNLPEVDINSVELNKDFILPDGTIISHNEDRGEGILFWIKDVNGEEHVLPAMTSGNVKRARQLINYMATQPEIPRDYIDYAQKEFLSGRNINDIVNDINIKEQEKAELRRSKAVASHKKELANYQTKPDYITINHDNPKIEAITLTAQEIADAKSQGINEATALENKKLSEIYKQNCTNEIQTNTANHIKYLEHRFLTEIEGIEDNPITDVSKIDEPIDVPYDAPVSLPDGTTVTRRQVKRVDEVVTGLKPTNEPYEIFTVKEPDGKEYNLYVSFRTNEVNVEATNLLRMMKQVLDGKSNTQQHNVETVVSQPVPDRMVAKDFFAQSFENFNDFILKATDSHFSYELKTDKDGNRIVTSVSNSTNNINITERTLNIIKFDKEGNLVDSKRETPVSEIADFLEEKDLAEGNETLETLYAPLQILFNKNTMSPEKFDEYNAYYTAFVKYERLTELGVEDGSNPPKLPKGFNERLRVENIRLLKDTAAQIKSTPEKGDELLNQYERNLIKNTHENTTSTSYVKTLSRQNDKTYITQQEAELRLSKISNTNNSNLIDVCRTEDGKISNHLITEMERLNELGIDEWSILDFTNKVKDNTFESVADRIAEFKSKYPDKTPGQLSQIIKDEIEFYNTLKGLNHFNNEQKSDLKEVYRTNPELTNLLVNQKSTLGGYRQTVADNIRKIVDLANKSLEHERLVKKYIDEYSAWFEVANMVESALIDEPLTDHLKSQKENSELFGEINKYSDKDIKILVEVSKIDNKLYEKGLNCEYHNEDLRDYLKSVQSDEKTTQKLLSQTTVDVEGNTIPKYGIQHTRKIVELRQQNPKVVDKYLEQGLDGQDVIDLSTAEIESPELTSYLTKQEKFVYKQGWQTRFTPAEIKDIVLRFKNNPGLVKKYVENIDENTSKELKTNEILDYVQAEIMDPVLTEKYKNLKNSDGQKVCKTSAEVRMLVEAGMIDEALTDKLLTTQNGRKRTIYPETARHLVVLSKNYKNIVEKYLNDTDFITNDTLTKLIEITNESPDNVNQINDLLNRLDLKGNQRFSISQVVQVMDCMKRNRDLTLKMLDKQINNSNGIKLYSSYDIDDAVSQDKSVQDKYSALIDIGYNLTSANSQVFSKDAPLLDSLFNNPKIREIISNNQLEDNTNISLDMPYENNVYQIKSTNMKGESLKIDFKLDENGDPDIISTEKTVRTERTNSQTGEKGSHYITTKNFADNRRIVEEMFITAKGSENERIHGYKKTVYDASGVPQQSEVMRPTETIGEYTLSTFERQNGGYVRHDNAAIKYSADGRTVERNMTSVDGVQTRQVKTKTQNGNSSEYTIIDSDGKTVLFSQTRSHERVNDNLTRSSVNGQSYETRFNDETVTATKLDKDGNIIETIILGSDVLDPQLTELYKQLPGDYFFTLKDMDLTVEMGGIAEPNNACYFNHRICISPELKNDPFTFAHEFGHAIDEILLKNLSEDPKYIKLYDSALEIYRANSTDAEGSSIDYFTTRRNHQLLKKRYQEGFAETEGLISGLDNNDKNLGIRSIEYQRDFARVMAYAAKARNNPTEYLKNRENVSTDITNTGRAAVKPENGRMDKTQQTIDRQGRSEKNAGGSVGINTEYNTSNSEIDINKEINELGYGKYELREIEKEYPGLLEKMLKKGYEMEDIHSILVQKLRLNSWGTHYCGHENLLEFFDTEISDKNGNPDKWNIDTTPSFEAFNNYLELMKVTYKNKDGQDVRLFTNKNDIRLFAYRSKNIQNVIRTIQKLSPDYDIAGMDKNLLFDIAKNGSDETYIRNILKLSQLKTNDGKDRLLSRDETLRMAQSEDFNSTIELLQISRTKENGETETFSTEQIEEMQKAKVDITKLKELVAETYTDKDGNIKPRFSIEDLYNLSVINGFAVKKGYKTQDIQKLFDIKWNDNGTSILNLDDVQKILDSGADLNTIEKLYRMRGTNDKGGETCFSVDQVLDLSQKDFKNVYELYSMKYTDKDGHTHKRFSLADIYDLANYNVDDVVKLGELKWNGTKNPLFNAYQIATLLELGNTDKIVRLLKIRTNEPGESCFGLNQIKTLLDKNIEDIEKLANHKFKYIKNGKYLTLDTRQIVQLSNYDVDTAIKTCQRVLDNYSKYSPNINLFNVALQILETEKATGEKSAPQHQAEMYKYYSELTDKDGNRIFNGRNGRMDEHEVLMYMSNLPESSKEATAVRMLTSLVQDGQVGAHVLKYLPKEGHINPLIAEDVRLFYDAYLNNIPLNDILVPTRQSLSDISDVKTGDVFEVAGEKNIYIKTSDGKSVQLQMDKATYCKLFPPVERYATTQNDIGNCWQITGFNGILRDPVERLSVLETIRQDGDDIVIRFQNGRLGDIRFKNGELPKGADPKYYSEGALGINLLEYSQGLELQKETVDREYAYLYDELKNADTEEKRNQTIAKLNQVSQTLYKSKDYLGRTEYREAGRHGYDFAPTSFRESGCANWTWDLLGYKNAKDYSYEDYKCRPFLANPESFENHLVGWVTKGMGESEVSSSKGIVSGHVYWLKPNLDETGNIKDYDVINPWGIFETTLSLDEVMYYGKGMYVADKKQR